tara:strand:- start:365 stop:1087 length:723 start_codon:yes stop_codon:yes gene_type:complete
MTKKIVPFLSFIFLVSCSAPSAPFHRILGAKEWGFSGEKTQILLDAKIDKLQIRHVRLDEEECVSGYEEIIEIAGEIGPDSTEAIKRLLPQLHHCIKKSDGRRASNSVYLSSRGGLLSDGFEMGRIFRKHEVSTIITGWQVCASSCAIAFLGGKYRSMYHEGKLMFHAPYTTDGLRSVYGGLSIDCSDRGQVKDLGNYYNSVLDDKTGNYLLKRTMSYCSSSDGWVLNADGAKLLGLLTN